MKKLVIFGMGDIGALAHYYFTNDSPFEVVAFCVDAEYMTATEYLGLPVISFEAVEKSYPAEKHAFFVALAYSGLNELRRSRYLQAKNKGYDLASYVSSSATVLNDGAIGDNCFVLEDNTIQPFARIGNNVTLWSGNHIGHHSIICDHTFIASHVVVSGGVKIGESCFIGVNATLRNHISIGVKCVVGAGALLLSDADDFGVYMGSATERSRVPSSRLKSI